MRKTELCKKICALTVALIMLTGVVYVPNVSAEQAIFVDEFDGGKSTGTTKTFFSDNIREISSSTSQSGDFTRATRIGAEKDGILIYKSENVGAITMRGVYPKNGDFEFYYSTDNKEYIPIEPVYGNEIIKDSGTGWYGRDYFFAGFPSGILYFKIVIPKEDGNTLYNKQINYVKIEKETTTLIKDYDDNLINSFDLKSADNKVFETFEGQKYKEAMHLLYSMGIMDKRVLNPERFNTEISRGEFASSLVKLMGFMSEKYSDNVTYEKFSDISSSTDYAYCVQIAIEMGYMNKMSDNSFRPEKPMSEQDAMYALMCLLGYQDVVKNNSIPSVASNTSFAYKLKGGNLTVEDAAKMLFAFLNANMANNKFNGIIEVGKRTYLSDILEINRVSGQMNYSVMGSMDSTYHSNKNEVEIEGVVLKSENIKFHELLGRRVYAYIDDDNKVISFGIDEKTEPVSVYKRDVNKSRSDLSNMYYTKDGTSKRKSINVTKLVINGERIYAISKTLLYDCDVLNFYDSNNDGKLETVIAERYDDYFVKSIYVTEKGIADFYTGNTFYFDSTKYNNIIFFRDGIKANFSNIIENSVISVAKSSNNRFVKVVINQDSVSDDYIYEDFSENIFTIGKENYGMSDGLKTLITSGKIQKMQMGETGKFYLNAVGDIAAYEITSPFVERYGYIIRAYEKSSTGNIRVKIFGDDGNIETYDTRDKLSISFGTTSSKVNGSAAIALLKTAAELTNASGEIEGLVKYRIRDGVISRISVPRSSPLTNDFSMDYSNTAAFTNGNDIIDLKYIVNSDTKYFYIPYDRGDETGYQNKVSTVSTYSGTKDTYNIKLYDIDQNRVASAMVLFAEEFDADNIGLLWRRFGMVSSVRDVYDEENDCIRKQIKFVTQGAEQSYWICDNLKVRGGKMSNNEKADLTASTIVPSDIGKGDVIKYALNNKGEIGKLTLIYDASTKKYYKNDGTATTSYSVGTNGEIVEMYVTVDRVFGKYMIVETDSDTYVFDCSQAYASIYNEDDKTVYPASVGDIKPGDKVVIRAQRTSLQDVMIIK